LRGGRGRGGEGSDMQPNGATGPACQQAPLPHLGRGATTDGSPMAICIASSTSQKEEQVKDPRKLWGLSNTCLREQENTSLPKAKRFNTTALIPKNSSRELFALWTETRGYLSAIHNPRQTRSGFPGITSQATTPRQAKMKEVAFQTGVWSPDARRPQETRNTTPCGSSQRFQVPRQTGTKKKCWPF
jgi:hypothetical protein